MIKYRAAVEMNRDNNKGGSPWKILAVVAIGVGGTIMVAKNKD